MDWLLPIFLWLMLTGLAAWRDIHRIVNHLEYTYGIMGQAAIIRARIIAGLIYFPAFVIMVLAGWLGKTYRIGEFGICILGVVSLLWLFLGYTLTGGRSKEY